MKDFGQATIVACVLQVTSARIARALAQVEHASLAVEKDRASMESMEMVLAPAILNLAHSLIILETVPIVFQTCGV